MREDPWLAVRLGRPALWWEDGDDPAAVGAAARERGAALAQARLPADRVATLGALQDAGFRVVDATVTMAGAVLAPGEPLGFDVGDARPDEAAALLDVAERHFGVSRFHLDPAIPDAVAGTIKRDWVQAYLDGERGERLLAARRDGEPAGFLALLRGDDGTAVIDLIAVRSDLRGGGAGGALIRALDGERRIEAGTQLSNAAAQRFYARLGFAVARSTYVLHLHA